MHVHTLIARRVQSEENDNDLKRDFKWTELISHPKKHVTHSETPSVVKAERTKNLLDCVRGWGSASGLGWHSYCDFCPTAKAETAAWASEPALKALARIFSISSRVPSSVPANFSWSQLPLWPRLRRHPSRQATRGTSPAGRWTQSRSCGGTCHTKCIAGLIVSFPYFRGENMEALSTSEKNNLMKSWKN